MMYDCNINVVFGELLILKLQTMNYSLQVYRLQVMFQQLPYGHAYGNESFPITKNNRRLPQRTRLCTYCKCIYLMHNVCSYVVIIINKNSQCYKGFSPLGVMSNGLFWYHVQEPGSRVGMWEKSQAYEILEMILLKNSCSTDVLPRSMGNFHI